MNVRDTNLFNSLNRELTHFSTNQKQLIGLGTVSRKDVFIYQIIDSVRRVRYASTIANKRFDASVSNPSNTYFDPLKAAVYHLGQGNIDEASWLVFLATHFGYSPSCGWNLTKDVYGKLGSVSYWTWNNISQNIQTFSLWSNTLQKSIEKLLPKRRFGNHRKYESLNPTANRALHLVISSYVNLIQQYQNHQGFFNEGFRNSGDSQFDAFDKLYDMMNPVISFGRTAKFDFLTMIGKLGIANIEPPKTYIKGSTGPISGAKLLFENNLKSNISTENIELYLFKLSQSLSINPFGMQVLEDALCNWQKSPENYIHFRG
ncbi:hypothetical protein MSP8887_00070 [Marinomonas spartinae]|uniref:alpha-glutamyl/putrescinyl thymine pyrophosphorylase clade 3 protein n=1 Tax=Marinomonas spartinae TaxID=1792290 RepID=UPI0008090BFB|nr:hypothetical protein [Marinomonas spartinae]SBS24900.1 hypothetical protein MSP8887_00070 [Marinomonas spartinae]